MGIREAILHEVEQRGMQKGIQKGTLNTRIAHAKAMLEDELFQTGILSYERIAQFLQLSAEEVQKIHETMED